MCSRSSCGAGAAPRNVPGPAHAEPRRARRKRLHPCPRARAGGVRAGAHSFASPLRRFYSGQLARVLSALDASRRGTANFTLGTVAISRADWDEARGRLRDAIRLAIEAGRPQSRIRADGQLFQSVSLCAARRMRTPGRTHVAGNQQPGRQHAYAVWWTAIQGAIAVRRGNLEEARPLLLEADRALASIGDAMATVFIGGTLAWVERLRGDVESAREVCSRTVASTRKRFSFPVGHTLVEGYGFLTQVADWLPGSDPATVLLRQQAWKLQRTHAMVFPSQERAWRWSAAIA